jgi:hypothetical protein
VFDWWWMDPAAALVISCRAITMGAAIKPVDHPAQNCH